jgi:hypothetical protein
MTQLQKQIVHVFKSPLDLSKPVATWAHHVSIDSSLAEGDDFTYGPVKQS